MIFDIQKFCLHDGPGIRTTVFFKGCNLRCKWCANPEAISPASQQMSGKTAGRDYELKEVLAEVLKDKPFYDSSGGGVTFSGGEPLLQADFVCGLCDALHAAGVNVAIETAANVPGDVFSRVIEKCDFALIDLKHWNSQKHLEGTGVDNKQILSNLRIALSSLPTTVRVPVIPEFNHSDDDARMYAALLVELGARNVHVLPFHQFGENKYEQLGIQYAYADVPQLHEDDIAGFAKILSEAGLCVQVGG